MQAFDRTPRTSRIRPLGLAGAAVAVGATAASAQAGTILSPTAVVSNLMGNASGLDIGKVIDQSGLSGGFTSGTTDYSTYLLTSPTHAAASKSSRNHWQSSVNNTTGNIVFDLGAEYSIERLAFWPGGAGGVGGTPFQVNGITLETSSDLAFTSPVSVGTFGALEDPAPFAVNNFDLTDSSGRYVRLTINSNHGGSVGTTFGEIAFDVSAANAVPEPASGLLLLFAAGAALFVRRMFRRSRRPDQGVQ